MIAVEYPGYGFQKSYAVSSQNVVRAAIAVIEKTKAASIYGFSLGTGIAIEAVKNLKQHPRIIVLEGAFKSVMSSTYAKKTKGGSS